MFSSISFIHPPDEDNSFYNPDTWSLLGMVTTSTSFLAFSFLFSGLFRTQTVIYKKIQFISFSTLYLLTLPYNFLFFSQTTTDNE